MTTTTVEMDFASTTPGLAPVFQLDDVERGVLDNVEFTLGGGTEVTVDVTDDVRSVSLRRGRSAQLERFQAGAATVVLGNNQRQYDPSNALQSDTRTNLVPNPSFEVDTTGWSASATALTTAGATIARSAERALYGTTALRAQGDAGEGAHTVLTLPAGTVYRVSAYVRAFAGGASLQALDTTNGGTVVSSAAASVDDWTRLSTTVTTGASVANVAIALPLTSNGSDVFVDAVLVEAATNLDYYFDGALADGRILDASVTWTGTPHDSTSNLTYLVPNTGSPYHPSVRPRTPMRVKINGDTAFVGRVEDWDYTFSAFGDTTATAVSADGFAELARQNIVSASTAIESTGARINRVLDLPDVAWPASLRNIDLTGASLSSASIGEVNALEYLYRVEQAEFGALFMGKSGSLTYVTRGAPTTYTSTVFGDTTGIPFLEVSVEYGTETIKNQVIINRPGEQVITVEDASSIADYGIISYELRDTLLNDDASASTVALDLVETFAQPRLRVDRITVDLRAITPAQVTQVLDLELGDVVIIEFTPNRVGEPIRQALFVDAIEHNVEPQRHYVSLDLSEAPFAFILDSLILGILDASILS